MDRFVLTSDTIFKIAILLIGLAFLFEFHSFNQKGRYQVIGTDGGISTVFDTATGLIYLPGKNNGMPGSLIHSDNHKN